MPKQIAVALVVCIGLIAALMVITYLLLPKADNYYVKEMHRARIAEVESDIGMTCTDLYNDAMSFANREVALALEVGLRGGNWVSSFDDQQSARILDIAEDLRSCDIVSDGVVYLGLGWPDFRSMRELYSKLSIYLRAYSVDSAGDCEDGLPALDEILPLYRRLTDPEKKDRASASENDSEPTKRGVTPLIRYVVKEVPK